MECKICSKEVFDTKSGKQPQAFMSMNAESLNDVRCEEHKNR